MKFVRAVILVSILCLPGLSDVGADASSAPELPQFSPQEPPRPAPDIAVQRRGDGPVRLADFQGRPVLINLWATWCAPCVAEMPSLERLAIARAGKPLVIMAISSDRRGETVVGPFIEKLGLKRLPIYLDPAGDVVHAFGVDAIPTTILIDAKGREVGRLLGPAQWDGRAARDLIDRLLPSPSPDTFSTGR